MTNINELRRLAQAATPGPWYVTGKLTRYVEARIDGGLIQEVAACGPTKADGGYGPQQEANARLIAAANPVTINELLDRIEAAEKDIALKERVIDSLGGILTAVVNERDELRAKIEAMKKRLPYGAIGNILTEAMDIATANGADSRSMPDEYVEVGMWLCGIPGAQPAPSVPDLLESLRCACNYIDKLGGVSQQYRAMLATTPEAKP